MTNSKTTQYHYPSSCFTSSSSTRDVFLSFRHEEDAAKNFAHRLYKALSQAGIHTFIRDRDDDNDNDNEDELPKENPIPCLKAIQESSVSIVVFSKLYADCTRCLDELDKIMDCRRRTGGNKLVLPVFYDVDPSHVRRQTGSFGEALGRHEQEQLFIITDMGRKLKRWRAALTEVANLSGWDLRNVPHGR